MSDIDPERWKRIETILDKALELRSDERTAFLDNACAGDHKLRSEVEALLLADARSEELLPTARLADRLATTQLGCPAPGAREGERIGPYRLRQKLGEGGMGEVWEAEQSEPIRRRVALKIIKPGMDSKQVLSRFEAERQALALMNHANVAKVFDAGATEQQRPYFAMELVKGVPITEHCDRQRLSTRERLELFMLVCEGVQHAHQKGIIHRDIKPSNILVQTEGDKRIPKIIDFGVAKATAQRLTERTLFTELGQMIGTPEYMSPEQAEMTGEDIDTRTDVYSLGVVLYELLVGALPFGSKELRKAGFDEIRRMIREDEPSKPSTRLSTLGNVSSDSAQRRRTDPTTLIRQLRGDLDWITMRALEKDRTRRYSSPSELEADIKRHVMNLPVLAGPPSTIYRFRKFARRHKLGVAISTISLFLLATLTVLLAVQAREIMTERERADREVEISERISDFLSETVGIFHPGVLNDEEPADVTLLRLTTQQVEDKLESDPETQSRLLRRLGVAYRLRGHFDEGARLLEKSVSISTRLHGPSHPQTIRTIESLGHLYIEAGRYDKAEPLVLDGYEALDDNPRAPDRSKREALEQIVELYAAWGKPDKVTEWRAKLLDRDGE